MEEQKLIDKLKTEGFEEVYVWEDKPDEDYPSHSHAFDTKLIVLSGEISFEIASQGDRKVLRAGDELEIPADILHSATVGSEGCRYIVAEKK